MLSKFLLFSFAAMAFAQGPRGPQPGMPGGAGGPGGPGSGTGLDMTKVQTVEGSVSAVNIGYGTQYPSIQINLVTIKVAPVWFLLENNFEIKVGDKLKVTAAPSLQARDPYLSAVTLTNTASGAELAVRDSNGTPLWAGQKNGGNQQGPGVCGGCVAAGSVTAVSGTVDQVSAGLGIQMPALVLKTADSKVLTIKIGPERVLEAADFEIKAGDALTVKYALTCTDEVVALELVNAAGVTVALRNPDGTPAWK